jgi:ComF family protein
VGGRVVVINRLFSQYSVKMLTPFLQGLFRHLPSQCAVCHRWPSQPVCEDCVQCFAQPAERCKRCALPEFNYTKQCCSCSDMEWAFDNALAAVDYAYPWSTLIQAFKFKEQTGWARSMATLLRCTPWVEPALDAADWLIPMPLSHTRLKERGFNQTAVLAQALCPEKMHTGLLQRIRHSDALSGMDRQQRARNIHNAYALTPSASATLRGKKVVLLDDVMTTGASLHAAAHVLRQADVSHITALVFARTPASYV